MISFIYHSICLTITAVARKLDFYGYRIKIAIALMLLLSISEVARAQYYLVIFPGNKEAALVYASLKLQTSFRNRSACAAYIYNLQNTLLSKGYPAASVDSVHYDSAKATVYLYTGRYYEVASISISDEDQRLVEQSGWNMRSLQSKPLTTAHISAFQSGILNYLENNGYPFARLQLDSIVFNNEKMAAKLKIEEGPLYKIDSIRVYGNAKIANTFLQQYLQIPNGTIYRKAILQNISKKLSELPYLQEQQTWNMTMLGTGSVLNLYLQSRKSSQVDVLVGFLPSNEQTINNKILITGDANINLRNAFGTGEIIGLNWQQIQIKSPRLNLAFQQPFVFGSAFGIHTTFDLFKKDSSFLNLNFLAGLQYALSTAQKGSVFIQNLTTNLLSVDTSLVKRVKKLPDQIDASSFNLGVSYEINTTDYRFNPKRGFEVNWIASAGLRKLRKNNVILTLKDPLFSYASLYDSVKQNSYQLRARLNAAYYIQAGQQSTFKTAVNSGWFHSPAVFRNELFQIGGYKLLRGFDEESIFASGYVTGTFEYRYLIGINSFLSSFIDAGWTANNSNNLHTRNKYLGGGIGLALETKAGIINISYAAGKRDDSKFNLRQSKIHIGYVNYF